MSNLPIQRFALLRRIAFTLHARLLCWPAKAYRAVVVIAPHATACQASPKIRH